MNVNAMVEVVARNYPGSDELNKWAAAIIDAKKLEEAGEPDLLTFAEMTKGIGDNLARAIATEAVELFTEDLGPNRNLITLKQTLRRWIVDLHLVVDTLDAEKDERMTSLLEGVAGQVERLSE